MKKTYIAGFALIGFLSMQAATPDENQPQMPGKSDALVSLGLSDDARSAITLKLNGLLADEYTLYIRTQKFHWNVVGPFFGPLHKLFNDQFDMIAENIDAVAERIRALGFKTIGTLAEFKLQTVLSEDPGNYPDSNGMIASLLEGHETVIKNIRPIVDLTAQLNDMGTNNFLAGLLEKHEKAAWFLRAHLLAN